MKFLFIIPLLLSITSCTTRTVTLPDGRVVYKSSRFGNKESIKRFEFSASDGTRIVIEGYSGDQVEALGIVTKAAVEGAVEGMK